MLEEGFSPLKQAEKLLFDTDNTLEQDGSWLSFWKNSICYEQDFWHWRLVAPGWQKTEEMIISGMEVLDET